MTGGAGAATGPWEDFEVELEVYTGPFEVLLNLIARHHLDITTVSLSQVTTEFIAFIRAHEDDLGLERLSAFLVVAATLLDLKAARLLPRGEVEDEADIAALEARDVLFVRLLQYRAFRDIAAEFDGRIQRQGTRHPRTVPLDPTLASLLPEVVLTIGPDGLARLAAAVLVPKPAPTVDVEHVHAVPVSVAEQREVVLDHLHRAVGAGVHACTFAELVVDAPDRVHIVARFMAVLELFRDRFVDLAQDGPRAPITVRLAGEGGSIAGSGQAEDGPDADPARTPDAEANHG